MDDDELLELLATLRDGVIVAQAVAQSGQYVVRELMVEVARLHADPKACLDRLYDRAAARLDPAAEQQSEKRSATEARAYLGAMFRDAALQLDQGPAGARRGRRH